jgi:hypothetical protein
LIQRVWLGDQRVDDTALRDTRLTVRSSAIARRLSSPLTSSRSSATYIALLEGDRSMTRAAALKNGRSPLRFDSARLSRMIPP